MPLFYFLFTVILAAGIAFWHVRRIKALQLATIASYRFHPALRKRLKETYPHLSDAEVNVVMDGLRDYFWCCHRAGGKIVSMPSQAVDSLWHDFILFTRAYGEFCRHAFGHYLHHTPAEAMQTPTTAQEGIKRAWRLCCAKEGIDPSAPQTLPRLFAIDADLSIPKGFVYSLNCQDRNSPLYGDSFCASHIGCGSGCGDDASSCDSDGGCSDGGGGCGGD